MSGGWSLIVRGFAIAALGAGATAFYIVGASWLYIGRAIPGGVALAGALLGGIAFKRLLGPYLDLLDAYPDAGPAGSGAGAGGNGRADGGPGIHA